MAEYIPLRGKPYERYVKSVDTAVKSILKRKTFDKVKTSKEKVQDVVDRTRVARDLKRMKQASAVSDVSERARITGIKKQLEESKKVARRAAFLRHKNR